MEIQTGGGVLGLGNPDGKKHAIRRGCVDFFWNNPLQLNHIIPVDQYNAYFSSKCKLSWSMYYSLCYYQVAICFYIITMLLLNEKFL